MPKILNVISENNDDLGWDVIRSRGAVTPQPTPTPTDYFAHKHIVAEDNITGEWVQVPQGWGLQLSDDSNIMTWFGNEFDWGIWSQWIHHYWTMPQDYKLSFVFSDGRIYTTSAACGTEEILPYTGIIYEGYPYHDNLFANDSNNFAITNVSGTGEEVTGIVFTFNVTLEEEPTFHFHDVAVVGNLENIQNLEKVVLWCSEYNPLFGKYQAWE